MRKTDILDLAARKLAPYMFLFGLYLVSFGGSSPGGGFQGGVVIASGLILVAMARNVSTAEQLFPAQRVVALETVSFALLLMVGTLGVLFGAGFLAPPFGTGGFIFILNMLIGIKVAAGVSLICLTLFREG